MSRKVKQPHMQQSFKYLINPEIIIDFVFEHGLFYIAVENIGNHHAYNTSVEFNKKIFGVKGSKEVSALALFKNIAFMPPSKRIVTFLDTSASYFQRGEPTKLSLVVRYQDKYRRKYASTIKHDLEIYREIGYINNNLRKDT